MPYFFCTEVPPPSGTLPPEVIAWPPISASASISSTEAPASRAAIAAGNPVAPEPTTTTSASCCHATIRYRPLESEPRDIMAKI